MSEIECVDLGEGRVQYRKLEGNTHLFVIYERSLTEGGELVEEIWEQGVGEVRWVQNPRPTVRELEAARRLFFEMQANGG